MRLNEAKTPRNERSNNLNFSILPYATPQPFHFPRGLFIDSYEKLGKPVSERLDIFSLGAVTFV